MIGILIILGASWLLLYAIEKKHLSVLGFAPIGKRTGQFLIGFVITGLLCTTVQLLEVWLKSADLVLSKNASVIKLFTGFWWDFKSVLTEELIYRGVLLYILIHRLGSKTGIAISASAFGIYHWFSYGVLGNPVAMILIFLGTGLMGYTWALSFHKTRSIMMGFGMHLGWNFVFNTIFSKGPLGEMFLTMRNESDISDLESLINFLIPMIAIPLLLLVVVQFVIKEYRRETLG